MADNGGARRRAGRRWVLWIVAGIAAVGAGVAVLGIWHLPDRMYPPGTDGGAEARAALQGGLLTAAAALTAVAGGLIALDETRQANAETRRANVAADVRERAANLNTHVRELYVEAAKLLNDPDNLGVRLAGIYALERIAVDSPADQRTVVEVLSAFVRTRSADPTPPPADGQDLPRVRPAADIRAVVQVLGRLPIVDGVPRCDLNGADLTGPASLSSVDLTRANLSGAWLVGVDLTGARLIETDLSGAQLFEADLSSVDLKRADLAGARLSGVGLVASHLTETNLSGADLNGADLSSARLSGADLSNADLHGARLAHARVVGTDLSGAYLAGVNLSDAHLFDVDFTGAQGLTAGQVAVAFGSARTRLPEGMVRPGSWPPYDPSAPSPGEAS